MLSLNRTFLSTFHLILILFMALNCLFMSGFLHSQPIYYNQRKIEFPSSPEKRTAWETLSSQSLLLLRLEEKAGPKTRTELERSGVQIISYIPDNSYLVYVKDLQSNILQTLKTARIVEPLKPEWKIDPVFHSLPISSLDSEISIVIYAASVSSDLIEAIETHGGLISSRPLKPQKGRVGIQISPDILDDFLIPLSQRPEVYLIQPGGRAVLLNDNASEIVQSGQAASGNRPIWDHGIYGQGQIIAIIDTGLDYDSCYFDESDHSPPPLVFGGIETGTPDYSRRKVIVYDFLYSGDFIAGATHFDNQGHGTLVAGNASGSSLSSFIGRNSNNGIAPLSQIIMQDGGFTTWDNCSDLVGLGCPVVDLTPFLDQAVNQGAHIHNNSWGDRENFVPQNLYTGPTADMDDAMWRNPEFLIVCAAGNSGSGIDTVGSPSIGKNVLSVGAGYSPSYSGDEDQVAGFSSRGWTSDGRIKPDLIAPGQTQSARSDYNITTNNCSTSPTQGTSMASPVTAGCAALVREYYCEGWYPSGIQEATDAFIPTSALLKATLFAGTVDMTATSTLPPNRDEGWGRIHLDQSLYFNGDARKLIVVDERTGFSSSSDEPIHCYFDAGGNTTAGQLKVVLVWTDYPANPAASISLVNDLDLVVTNLDTGAQYYGNHIVSGVSIEGGTRDSLNNVEVAILPSDTIGRFEATLYPTQIIEANQGFALVVAGDVEETFPSTVPLWQFY